VLTHVTPGIIPSLNPEQPEPVHVKEMEKVLSSPQLRYEPCTEVILAVQVVGEASVFRFIDARTEARR
jgi:hypothetical protein